MDVNWQRVAGGAIARYRKHSWRKSTVSSDAFRSLVALYRGGLYFDSVN